MSSLIRKWMWCILGLIACRGLAQDPAWRVNMEEVTVTARKLTETGVTRTVLDSTALRQNAGHSLADLLTQNSSVFIKSYGRGTLATASFRGTSPSHTQVQWNGLKLNSPMLGMVDFSLIPSYLIDGATLYHGAGSVGMTGGGLGGAIALDNKPFNVQGVALNFIQGISSFHTVDDFLRLSYGSNKFQSSTRFYYANSRNDFPYRNYDKIGEDGQSHPLEHNKNGSFRDWHLLQEFYYRPDSLNRLGLKAWVMNSRRGIPMLSVSYREEDESKNQQDEKSVRLVGQWDRTSGKVKMEGRMGWVTSELLYRQWSDVGAGQLIQIQDALSRLYTGYGEYGVSYSPSDRWLVTGRATVYLHTVQSLNRKGSALPDANRLSEGYHKKRLEGSLYVSVKYRPHPRVSLGVDLREENYGRRLTPPIPAVFADYQLWPRHNLIIKTSVARNYRYPSLNDLYFQPGGNPLLRPERGLTCEGGLSFGMVRRRISLEAEGTIYNSQINDWILWLPAGNRGYWTPVNVKRVHSYGVELRSKLAVRPSPRWLVSLEGQWAWTRSVNRGDPQSQADASIGKQLVYVPEFSASLSGRVNWRGYGLTYKFYYYSERFTTSSNETSSSLNRLAPYYMNDLYVEKNISFRVAELSLRVCVYNLYDRHYVSVLSRPMPGRNFGFFIGITPKW